jgi:hypothetical protein
LDMVLLHLGHLIWFSILFPFARLVLAIIVTLSYLGSGRLILRPGTR